MFRLLLLALLFSLPAHAASPLVLVLELRGAVSPASADYLHQGLTQARERQAALVVVELDTPGGLDAAMRAMVQEILSSTVPVAIYVAPNGARAASAGTYLLYASHFAAMAPATNVGAATPVQIGAPDTPRRAPSEDKSAEEKELSGQSTMERKQISDSAAYLRSLAQHRGRNAEWAERAVRESVSLSADEALRLKVIDIVAADLPDLLRQIDGRKITVGAGTRVVVTKDAQIEAMPPNWRTRVLAVIADPNVALLLMMAGIWGLIFEFANPGLVLPGVVGAVCLGLAAFALQILPVNYAGLLLIVLGIAFMVAEAFFVPAFGALGLGGLVAFIAGGLILFDTAGTGFSVPVALIVGLALSFALVLALAAKLVLKARKRPASSGSAELIGATGEIVSWQEDTGWLKVRGELWKATSDRSFAPGEQATVVAAEGHLLRLKRRPHAG